MTMGCCEQIRASEHKGQSSPGEISVRIVEQGKMETQGNRIKSAAPAPTLANVALRVALWVVYGGAAAEMVYGSQAIEEGMVAAIPDCSAQRPN
jgi:hypothetical protein